MSYVILILATVFLVSGFRNTQSQLFSLLRGDFTGTNNFIYWALAIGAVGGLGYFKSFRPIANSLLALIIVVLVLKNGSGFFDQFTSQIAQGTQPGNATQPPATANTNPFAQLLNPQVQQGLGWLSNQPGFSALKPLTPLGSLPTLH